MKKALHKDIIREIKKTRARILSIFMMSALGVAFFSGIKATEPDMLLTADAYMDTYDLADIRLMNTLGFDEEGVEAIRQIEGVETVEPSWTAYMLAEDQDAQYVVQLFADTDTLSRTEVTKGRLPDAPDELLIDERLAENKGLSIGDTLTLSTGTDAEVTDTLTSAEFRIVGLGNSPTFISIERGSATIGNGAVSGFAIASEEAFVSEYYSMLYIKAAGAEELLCYSDEYTELIENLTERIEAQTEKLGEERYDRLVDTVTEALEEGEAELAEKSAEAEAELADAKKQLEEARTQITEGWQEIEANEQRLADGRKALEEGEAQLNTAREELETAKTQIETGKTAIASGEIQIETYKAQLAQGEAELRTLQALYPSTLISIESIDSQIAQAEEQIAQARSQLAQAQAEIENYKAQVSQGEARIAEGEAQLAAGEQEIEARKVELTEGEAALEEGRIQLQEAEAELAEGEAEYAKGEEEARTQIAEAEEKLADARKQLEKIEEPEWYVLDRRDNTSYEEYGDNAGSIGAIGEVFPLLFFLVAALVSLTTMTRMVEEQRTQIGTMKALGYSKAAIASKYIFYAMSATISGSLVGLLFGQKFFPFVIINAFGIMYSTNSCLQIPYQWGMALVAAGVVIFCNLAATLSSCMKAFRSVPAALMRPAAPKQGKRVFLEYIPFLWKRMNFTQKAAIRNLFRYKKRFFMTLFGVGGCMALLVVGWGLRDSIMRIADIQYENIQVYDSMLVLDTEAEQSETDQLLQQMEDSEDIAHLTRTYMKNIDVSTEEGTLAGYLCVAEEPETFEELVLLQAEADEEEQYHLGDSGILLTSQMAQKLGVSAGDRVTLKSGEGKSVTVTVDGVVKNYIMHYIYMSGDCYEQLYGESAQFSTVLYSMAEESADKEKEVGEELLTSPASYAITYVSDSRARIDNMLQVLNMVVGILIVSAGLLAYVVLYNLNNINITERRRELATLKVLGFYDMEVSTYVYRENVILTVLGILVGMVLGKYLHQFIIQTLKVNQIVFGKNIYGISYLLSALLTMAFASFVNYIMYRKLKEINMVESLKSVE